MARPEPNEQPPPPDECALTAREEASRARSRLIKFQASVDNYEDTLDTRQAGKNQVETRHAPQAARGREVDKSMKQASTTSIARWIDKRIETIVAACILLSVSTLNMLALLLLVSVVTVIKLRSRQSCASNSKSGIFRVKSRIHNNSHQVSLFFPTFT